MLCVIGCRSKDGDLDGAVRVDDVNEQSLIVLVGRVCRHDERDAKLHWTRRSDVVVIQRLSRVLRVFNDDAERPCTVYQIRLTSSNNSFEAACQAYGAVNLNRLYKYLLNITTYTQYSLNTERV